MAASAAIAACNQPTGEGDGGPGLCGSLGGSCAVATDCCTGFACESALCVFIGSQSGSAGNGNSGSSSAGSSGGIGGGSSGGLGTTSGNSSGGSSGGPGGNPGGSTGSQGNNGGSTSSGGGSSSGGDFVTAAHSMTQVPFQGGPTLGNPVLVTITFQDDTNRGTLEQFGQFLVGSSWYTQVSPQFNLGAASEINVELAENSPSSIDDSVIQTNLAALIEAGTVPGLGGGTATLADTVYMIYYPSTTSITIDDQAVCTVSAGGYHSESTLSTGESFTYATVTNCVGALPVNPPENIEWAASHEFIEAATDPLPDTDPGYLITSETNPWALIGGEVADLCTGIFPQWSEGGYNAINRVWSNGPAAAGGDPCQPEPAGDPFYSTDDEPLTLVPVTAGSQTTFTVTGWSTGVVPDWEVLTEYYEGTFTAVPTLTPATPTLNNGQTASLTIAVPAGTASQSYSIIDVLSGNSQSNFTSTIVGVYVP